MAELQLDAGPEAPVAESQQQPIDVGPDAPIAWSPVPADFEQCIQFSQDMTKLTYLGPEDWLFVHSNKSFSEGQHFIVIVVHRIGDEGSFGITNEEGLVISAKAHLSRPHGEILQRPPGVYYYCGRRHKKGTLIDGCASLKIDGEPQKRMFHVADGAQVGLLLNFKTGVLDFFINQIWQGSACMPSGPVWITSWPDDVLDCFEILEEPVPYMPGAIRAWCRWIHASICSSKVQQGDIVQLSGKFGNVCYGPDLQDDVQVIFNDVYPDFFPISDDRNVSDLEVGRWMTATAVLSATLGIIIAFSLFIVAIQTAIQSDAPLKDNIAFKSCVAGFLYLSSLALWLIFLKVPDAKWKLTFYRALQIWPAAMTCIAIGLWGVEEVDLECTEDHWGPMFPLITQLYAPGGVDRHDLDGPLRGVLFNPLFNPPTLLLPSMEHPIPPASRNERTLYFMTELLLLVACTCAILECLSCLSAKCMPWPMHEPVATTDSALVPRPELDQERGPRATAYMCLFIAWYMIFQVLLYVEMDVMLMTGAVNLTTGPAWEFWIYFFCFICATHLASGIVRYVSSSGSPQKCPTVMVLTTITPFFGNEIHIFKDHVETALCFAVAHCTDGHQSFVATVLGCLSLLATFAPLPYLFLDATARQGLVKAHWPLLEAASPEPVQRPLQEEEDPVQEPQESWWEERPFLFKLLGRENGRRFVDAVVPAVTVEKQVRAFAGEFPDAVIDITFIFFFGGSPFMTLAIAISLAKIIGIPICREHMLPPIIRTCGCSMASLRLYRLNTPHIYVFNRRISIIEAAKKFQWDALLDELHAKGYPNDAETVQEALERAEKSGQGRHLRNALDSLGQATDYILVGALEAGDVELTRVLLSCGCNLRGTYSSYRYLINEFHGNWDDKGHLILSETGKQLMAAIEESTS